MLLIAPIMKENPLLPRMRAFFFFSVMGCPIQLMVAEVSISVSKKRMEVGHRQKIPIYTAVFFLNRFGLFGRLEELLAGHVGFLSWLHPESLGIVALQLTAEISAGLAVAGALLYNESLATREVVMALLAGNVLSAPMRAARHQFPYYAGIFHPKLAAELITYNQIFRIGSIILVGTFYYFLTA